MAVAPKAALTSAGTMRFPAPDEMSFEKAHFYILFDCLQSIKTKDVLKSIHYPILCVCVHAAFLWRCKAKTLVVMASHDN